MLLRVVFRERLTVLLALARSSTWVSPLQEPCDATNLYPGGEKLALTARGQESNNLPTGLATGKGCEVPLTTSNSFKAISTAAHRVRGAAAEAIQ